PWPPSSRHRSLCWAWSRLSVCRPGRLPARTLDTMATSSLGRTGKLRQLLAPAPSAALTRASRAGGTRTRRGVSARPSWLRKPRHNPKVSPPCHGYLRPAGPPLWGSNLDEGSRWWLCLQRTGLVLPPVTPRVDPGNVKVAAPTL